MNYIKLLKAAFVRTVLPRVFDKLYTFKALKMFLKRW